MAFSTCYLTHAAMIISHVDDSNNSKGDYYRFKKSCMLYCTETVQCTSFEQTCFAL